MQASPAAPQRTWLKVLVALVIVALAVVGYMSVSKKDAIPDVTFTNLQGKKFTCEVNFLPCRLVKVTSGIASFLDTDI